LKEQLAVMRSPHEQRKLSACFQLPQPVQIQNTAKKKATFIFKQDIISASNDKKVE
jgi:hypothetical protein